MILSDKHIMQFIENGFYLVNPFSIDYLQPSSVDLHLNNELKTIDGNTIDIEEKSYLLKPQEFILGSTLEKVKIPNNLAGHIDGRSSIGRLGILVHASAGYIDAGFEGNITLELYNLSNKSFELKLGDSICQILFETLSSPCMRPYGSDGLFSKYQYSEGTVRSKYESL